VTSTEAEPICILGAGEFGRAFARRCLRYGLETRIATRQAERPDSPIFRDDALRSILHPSAEALAGAGSVFVALPFTAALTLAQRFPGFASGRIVIDATNPLNSSGDGFVVAPETNGAIEIVRRIPYGRLVKAFNTMTSDALLGSSDAAPPGPVFVAADDADAKRVVIQLAESLGLRAVDAGVLVHAREIEGLVLLRNEICRRSGSEHGADRGWFDLKRGPGT
jgi:predicted dinucleotide-binding enzyme